MRISDWSSDVCSSDLVLALNHVGPSRFAKQENDRRFFSERAPEVLFGIILHPSEIGHRRVVEEDVKAAHPFESKIYQPFAALHFRQVYRAHRIHCSTGIAHHLLRDLRPTCVDIAPYALGAFLGQPKSRCTANAAPVAGDKDAPTSYPPTQ